MNFRRRDAACRVRGLYLSGHSIDFGIDWAKSRIIAITAKSLWAILVAIKNDFVKKDSVKEGSEMDYVNW